MKAQAQTASLAGRNVRARDRELISDVISRWRTGENPDAYEFLTRHPQVSARHSFALELAYEEYCLRRDGGEPIRVSNYCRRFPGIHKSLARQIEIHEFLETHEPLADRFARVSWPQVGDTIFEKFEVLEELGTGGLAKVYLCRQLGVGGRQVVVKMAASGSYEADTLGRLSHPHIVPVLDVITSQDKHTGATVSGMYMPFRGRSTLCDLIDVAWGHGTVPQAGAVLMDAARRHADSRDRYDQQSPATSITKQSYVDTILHLGLALADALRHTHAQGVLHGDLKPSNVLLTHQGQPQLFDFNLSFDETARQGVTGGTLPYMSPEQVRWVVQQKSHEPNLDERADLFSVGAILYELLTGELPFGALEDCGAGDQEVAALLEKQRRGAPSIHRLNPDVPPEISACLMTCLAFDREDRPASVDEWQHQLRQLLLPARKASRFVTANWRQVAALLLGFALIAAGYTFADLPLSGVTWATPDGRSDGFARNYQRGRERLQAGEWGPARACFLAAYRDIPEPQLTALIGYCNHRQRKIKAALENYLRSVDDGFVSVGLYNNIGFWYLSRGQLDEAETWLNRALKLQPDAVVPRFNRVFAEMSRGECNLSHYPAAVLADMQELVQDCEPNAYLYFVCSRLYAMAARVDEKWLDASINLLLLSWEHGMDVRGMGIDKDIAYARVKQDPRFAGILQLGPKKRHYLKFPRYLDPALGIEEPTASSVILATSIR